MRERLRKVAPAAALERERQKDTPTARALLLACPCFFGGVWPQELLLRPQARAWGPVGVWRGAGAGRGEGDASERVAEGRDTPPRPLVQFTWVSWGRGRKDRVRAQAERRGGECLCEGGGLAALRCAPLLRELRVREMMARPKTTAVSPHSVHRAPCVSTARATHAHPTPHSASPVRDRSTHPTRPGPRRCVPPFLHARFAPLAPPSHV